MPSAPDDTHIPEDWQAAADRIRAEGWRKVMVLGATDTGKSTFCHQLGRHLAASNRSVAFLEADVGQTDLGPPATISLGHVDASGACRPVEHAFAGSTNPAAAILPIVACAGRLAGRAAADFLIVNTSGLLQGPGERLKHYKIEAVAPSGLVILGDDPALRALRDAFRFLPQIAMPPAMEATRKSQARRRANRQKAFKAYFENADTLEFDLAALPLQRGRRTGEALPAGIETSLLCGVTDEAGTGLGLALVKAINVAAGRITLLTPVPRQHIAALQLGAMRLDAQWHTRHADLGRHRL